MSESKEYTKMNIVSILRKIADLLDADPDFPDKLSAFLDNYQEVKVTREEPASEKGKITGFDIFAAIRTLGINDTRLKLADLEVDELKAIVSKNAMDTTGKVRKWKSKEKLIEFIIEVASRQMDFGKSILSEEQKG